MEKTRILTMFSKILSAVFHPVLMPLYIMAVLLSNGLLLSYTTSQARIYFLVVMVLNTIVVPAICIFLFNKIKFWRKNPNNDFRERILPMLVMAICYMACIYMIKDIAFAYPVKKMLVAGVGCLIFGFAVSFFRRISLYMVAQGAVTAFFVLLLASGATKLLWVLCVSVVCASVVASTRLYLDKHNLGQVFAGFISGFAITFLSVYVI